MDKIDQYIGEIAILIGGVVIVVLRQVIDKLSGGKDEATKESLSVQDLFEGVYERERIMIEEINRLKKFATEASVSMSIMERLLKSAGIPVDDIPIPRYESGTRMNINITNSGDMSMGDITSRDKNSASNNSDIDTRRRGL